MHMFKRYWRPIVFFLFTVGFLITAPVVVLYTAGYRYHFGTGKIVQTGIITISSIPKGADVLIDTQRQDQRTPAVIGNILPGSHEVRVEKSGYVPWMKNLSVHSKQSTFVTDVVLFLDEPATTTGQATNVAEEKKSWTPVAQIYTIKNTQDRSILAFSDANDLASIIAYLPLSIYEFAPAPAPYLLVTDTSRGRVILIDTQKTQQPILLNADANQWAWSPVGDALLFSDGFGIEVYVPSLHIRETITRLSEPISGLRWYPLGRVALYSYGGDIFAQELDRQNEPNKITLVEGLNVLNFWIEEDGKWLVGVMEDGGEVRKRLQR